MNIVEFLKNWVIDIAILFVIVSLVEIVVPNSNMKRYINVVIGMLIIIVIIAPFVSLIKHDYDIDKEIYRNIINQFESNESKDSKLLSAQEMQIKEIYINKLKNDIKKLINEESDYEVVDVNVYISEKNEDYGDIEGIELVLNNEIEKEKNSEDVVNVIKIEEIKVDSKKQDTEKLKEFKDDEIEKLIFERYNISKDNIKIYLNTIKEGEFSGKVN